MDLVLVSIAALSLIVAIAMSVILFKVLREERQRSDARVAVLAAAAARFDLPLGPRVVAEADPTDMALSPTGLFSEPHAQSPWGARLGVAAALTAVIAVAGYALLPAKAVTPQSPAGASAQAPPLELLTLTHTQEPSGLTITGTIYNPRGASPLTQVSAAAVLFGPDGNFLTSGRAAVDFPTLAPGQESPFVIAIPVNAAVARYRVGFRAADGTVIAHIDRRADATAAQNAAGGTPWAR